MALAGPAQYFWSEAGSNGKFMYAGDTKAYVSFDQVKTQLEAMPEAFHKGEIFKPNDLGLLRLNSAVFSYKPSPFIALSNTKEDHAIVRPALMAMFANTNEWSINTFAEEASSFFTEMKAKGSMTQADISTWNQRMLHKYGLKHEISTEEAAAYQVYGQNALKNAILPKAVLNKLTEQILTFAGGLSIPSVITSMLGVLYSGKHGDYSKTYSTPAFLWETVRYYPAVVGVPFAKTGTTQREDVLLPSALTDKAVWGNDATEFKLRDESVYKDNIDVAWAGFATSTKFPNDSHSCPGIGMSKAIMLGFMKAFKNNEWKVSEMPKQVTKAPVAWNGFSLNKI